MATPGKFDAKVREQFLELLEDGETVRTAAALCGVTHQTVAYHANNNEEFRVKKEIAMRKADSEVVGKFWEQVQEGNWSAIKYWLSNRLPEEFIERKRQEMTGKNGEPIKSEQEISFDEGQADKFIRAVQSKRARSGDNEEGAE